MLRFTVQDTGIGIRSEDLSRLFNAFEQADNSDTRKYGGTGLGLAITLRLAQIMGGDAGASSQPGVGSTFWFSARLRIGEPLPRRQPEPDSLPPEQVLLRDYPGRRVLLAEDEPVNREIALILLEEIGQQVDVAEDGEQAVEMALTQRYDLILMDVRMPRLNGIDACQRIRAQQPDTLILAMTANAFAEDKARCLAAGMNDFLAKPVDADEFFAMLLRWFTKFPGVENKARTLQ